MKDDKTPKPAKVLLSVDCVIFGYHNNCLKLLLVKSDRCNDGCEWGLAGSVLLDDESLAGSAKRVLERTTGIAGGYTEPLGCFCEPGSYCGPRTVSMAYLSLINTVDYYQAENNYQSYWFAMDEIPAVPAGQREVLDAAINHLRYKASQHPILFELLPRKFTLPQLQRVYENIYGKAIDHRNFHRKIMTLGLLIKQQDKNMDTSKRGAYFYTLDKTKYNTGFNGFLNIVPHEDTYIFLKQ